MTVTRRWTVVAAVLVIAATAAFWPRSEDGRAASTTTPSAGGRQDLPAARAKAQLRPCPNGVPQAPADAELAQVTADCLGDGTSIDLGPALAGRPALINVWATWCGPCREELPVLESYAISEPGVTVLGVQIRSDPADGLELLADLGVRFPSVHDTSGAVAEALRLPAYLPVSYVVRSDGGVRQVTPPTPFTSVEQVREAVNRYTG